MASIFGLPRANRYFTMSIFNRIFIGLLCLFYLSLAHANPVSSTSIDGWTHVTQPLEATGDGIRVDIGGGNNDHADLSTFDPGTLSPGSVVNIWHRSTPYSTVHLFHKDGTEDQPIIVNGVTDFRGNRPVFDCTNRRIGVLSAFGRSTLENLGFFILSYNRDGGSYADPVEWNTFQNLHIRNCSASIRLQGARHTAIQYNVIDTNNNGIFVSDVGGGSYSTVVRGNHFKNNGTSGGYSQHSLYFQGLAENPNYPNLVEGNYFDEMLPSTVGMQIKTRATDTVIRYNTVICERICLELGELQGELPQIVYNNFSDQEIIDRLHTAYIYGNAFLVDNIDRDGSTYPFHFGLDTGSGNSPPYIYESGAAAGELMVRGVEGMIYFYHNSVAIRSNDYHQALFDLGWKEEDVGGNYSNTTLTNNIITAYSGGSGRLAYVRDGGNLIYSGVNHLELNGHSASSPFNRKNIEDFPSDSNVSISGKSAPTLVITKDSGNPFFENSSPQNAVNIDLRLQASSPAINAAGALPAAIPEAYFPALEPRLPSLGGGAQARSAYRDLGAIEYSNKQPVAVPKPPLNFSIEN